MTDRGAPSPGPGWRRASPRPGVALAAGWSLALAWLAGGCADPDAPEPPASRVRLVDVAAASLGSVDPPVFEVRPLEGGGGVAVGPVLASREWRECIRVRAGAELTLEAVVPTGAPVLSAWLLLHGARGGVAAEVSVSAAGGRRIEGRFDVARRWARVALDLRAIAGAAASVTFRVPPLEGGPGVQVLFGEPSLSDADADDPRPDVVLISLDTLRADHLALLGHPLPTSPSIDALAAGAAVFEQAVAPAPWTLPSHVSLLTGQYPDRHGVVTRDLRVPTSAPLLAASLRAAGYRTLAWTGGGYLDPQFGLALGFERYVTNDPASPPRDSPGMRAPDGTPAPRLQLSIDARRSLLDELAGPRAAPRFVFVHTFAVHDYKGSADVYRELGAPAELVPRLRRGVYDADAASNPFFRADLSPVERARLGELAEWMYCAGVREADRLVGDVVAALEASGRVRRTIVVVTSDHGEEHFEHGGFGHGSALFEESTRVPLVVSGPGVAPRRVREPCSLVDLAPTLLEWVGVPPGPVDDRDGRSLLAVLRGGALAPAAVLEHNAQGGESHAIRTSRLKLLVDGGRARLYDLEADAGESRDVADARAQDATRLQVTLERWVAELRRRAAGSEAGAISAELTKELEQLGYVGGR